MATSSSSFFDYYTVRWPACTTQPHPLRTCLHTLTIPILANLAACGGISSNLHFFESRVHSIGFSRFLAPSSSTCERARGEVRHARPLARPRAPGRFAEVGRLAAVAHLAAVSSDRGFFESRVHSIGFSRFLASSSSKRERARGEVRRARAKPGAHIRNQEIGKSGNREIGKSGNLHV